MTDLSQGEASALAPDNDTSAVTAVEIALRSARRGLLDLGTRNRLIHTAKPTARSKSIEIVDELSDEVFRILFDENRAMAFLPVPHRDNDVESEEPDRPVYLPPNDDEGLADRHIDSHLQTRLGRERLQNRLLSIHRDEKSLEDEQGVNVLFLALGFLHWFENDSSEVERTAPLLLLPVGLDRSNVRGQFRLKIRDEELAINLPLQQKMHADFGIYLPDFLEDAEIRPSEYLKQVRQAIAAQTRWWIADNEIILGFFSFSKYLMFRDLMPENWPNQALLESPILNQMLGVGFRSEVPLFTEDLDLDTVLDPADLIHIMDADSAQTVVIESVKQGRNLVVQGPPGTGKSQTIANVIAAAVHAGKTVFFVAGKMAALDVVQRRLAQAGLADLCLELHSRKANKKLVLDEVRRTIEAGVATPPDQGTVARLRVVRATLNETTERFHTPLQPSGVTPYRAIGELVALRTAGMGVPEFDLAAAAEWTADQEDKILAAIDRLADLTRDAGRADVHPWRGVTVRNLTPIDIDRLRPKLDQAADISGEFAAAVSRARELIRFQFPAALSGAEEIASVLVFAAKRPNVQPQVYAAILECRESDRLKALLDGGIEYRRIVADLDNRVADTAWDIDVARLAIALRSKGRSLFRWLHKGYRESIEFLKAVCIPNVPKSLDERKAVLEALLAGQRLRKMIVAEHDFAVSVFGPGWRGEREDFAQRHAAFVWVGQVRAADAAFLAEAAAEGIPDDELVETMETIQRSAARLLPICEELSATLAIDPDRAFDGRPLPTIPSEDLARQFDAWRDSLDRLDQWSRLYAAESEVRGLGADIFADKLSDGSIEPETSVSSAKFVRYEAVWKQALTAFPDLARFEGRRHEAVVEEFRALDRERMGVAAQEIAALHSAALPQGGAGEMGTIRMEIAKKRRHLPIRKLIERAGTALQRIKPVFLMSPLSIAQFLPPGRIEFDLLVIDEASQVKPEDALGAAARCRQIVVVGDTQQLPPTSFFDRLTSGSELEEEEEGVTRTGDMESVLTLCEAKGMPTETLRWHYRSKHPSLITVSNDEFYDHRLFLPPSPDIDGHNVGLRAQFVGGVYERGGSRTNRIEAQAVADAVIEHALNRAGLSLGVAALSIQQRDAIANELEFRRAEHPELENFFAEGAIEPFFVKNLENVQGDERDVIFISIGYGPHEEGGGLVSMGFGPVSGEGGERRLNVLFSRARNRCVVFTSIRSDQIDSSRTRNRGPLVLKKFLKYAESGVLDIPVATGRGFDSPFESAVAKIVRQLGYDVETQVGSAGFFIDLGVKDPKRPGRFMLGIECDGATYHSARWARERDRLRQEILENQGWRIHRIWSSDWFHRADEEISRLRAALGDAAQYGARQEDTVRPHAPSGAIRREPPSSEKHRVGTPYVEACVEVDQSTPPHEVPTDRLADVANGILAIEGPIHEEEVGRRITTLWGLSRAGSRIQAATMAALNLLRNRGLADSRGAFWSRTGSLSRPEPRNRTEVTSPTLRRPDMLPPSEVEAAVLKTVDEHVGLSVDELAQEVARLFGFKSTSAQIKICVERAVEQLVNEDLISYREGRLTAR